LNNALGVAEQHENLWWEAEIYRLKENCLPLDLCHRGDEMNDLIPQNYAKAIALWVQANSPPYSPALGFLHLKTSSR
jgi:hypothetical protein